MTPTELAAELGLDAKVVRAWLRREWPRGAAAAHSPWVLTEEQIAAARPRWSDRSVLPRRLAPARKPSSTRPRTRRSGSDEHYVLDLIDSILGSPASRQHSFDWLRGDPGTRGSRRLAVDGYWPDHRLVVEYREWQHDEAVPFFDKTPIPTISGVHRGEQRRNYDRRRDAEIPRHGLRLMLVRPRDLQADRRGRLLRDRQNDLASLRTVLRETGVVVD